MAEDELELQRYGKRHRPKGERGRPEEMGKLGGWTPKMGGQQSGRSAKK